MSGMFQWAADHCPSTVHHKPCAAFQLCPVLVCPFGATTKVWPHARVPSNHLVVYLGCGKWQVPIPLAAQFLTFMLLSTTLKLFCEAYVSGEYPKCKENQWPLYFCLGQEWHLLLHASHLAKLFLSWSPWQTIHHATSQLTAPCATRTICIGLHSWSTASINFLPAWDYQEDCPHHSRCWFQTVSLLIVTSLHCSALDHPCTPSHDFHFIPYCRRVASWVGILIWISKVNNRTPEMTLRKTLSSGQPYLRPPCNSFEGMSIKVYSIQVPVQDNSSMLYKSSLSSQAIVTCSVQYWGELPGPHSLSLSSCPTCTWHKIIESDSTLWHWRSAYIKFMRCK